MVILGWFLNTFGTIFTHKILQIDSHNCFNFVPILHKVTFHIKLHMSLGPVNHDQAFKWSSSHYCGGNVVSIHNPHFMHSILWCFCNTFFPTPIWCYKQGWMWSSNSWHLMHFGASSQLGCFLVGCGECLQFGVKRGHILKTLCSRWGHHITHPLCSCIWVTLVL